MKLIVYIQKLGNCFRITPKNIVEVHIKINEFGEKINRLISDIKGHFTEMEKLRYNNEEVFSLYAEFYQEILMIKLMLIIIIQD